MSRRTGNEDEWPRDEPQSNPRDLHPTSDIRFVMVEVARLSERVDQLTDKIDKISPLLDKAVERVTADFKERIADIKSDVKESGVAIKELEKSLFFFKGAKWVMGGLFALILIVIGVVLREVLAK